MEIAAACASGASVVATMPKSNLTEMFAFLAKNKKIVFKSQQIDEPELSDTEKVLIASEIFSKSHRAFLNRFGAFLGLEHLEYFEQLAENETEPDVQFIARNFIEEFRHKEKNTKNRRFAALKELIMEEDGYFSEREMMRREPLLYEQLVGQYLTDAERKMRDSYDPKNTVFSSILLESIDKGQTEELRKKQKQEEGSDDEATNESASSSREDRFPEEPPSFRKQWGNFEDDEASNFESQCKKQDSRQKYVTAGERDVLRQEFLGIMHSKFLDGEDSEFDYSKVDDNADYDDLEQIGQDKEDEYFDEDTQEEEGGEIREQMEVEESSEDELDLYMKSIK